MPKTSRPNAPTTTKRISRQDRWLRGFSKFLVGITLFLIFAGGMVTSTGSGLAVPDWPLSYGTLFPPMVGGVFYEHGHRMIASFVGLCTLVMAVWLFFAESRKWVRVIGYVALTAVIIQGLLGGITVLFYLPTAVSVSHGVLAQTFFLMTIFLAYSQSVERRMRPFQAKAAHPAFLKTTLILLALIFVQLVVGALMRHTGSGLALGDFPKMGGTWWPTLNEQMMFNINDWRFEQGFDPVNREQVLVHLLHRLIAVLILGVVITLNVIGRRTYRHNRFIHKSIVYLNILVGIQITLGIGTVLSIKEPVVTSLHVVTGAGTLGLSFLLFLRTAPIRFAQMKTELSGR